MSQKGVIFTSLFNKFIRNSHVGLFMRNLVLRVITEEIFASSSSLLIFMCSNYIKIARFLKK